jgi:protein-arginine kinase activator protein McsA
MPNIDTQTINCLNRHSFSVTIYADYRTENGQTLVCPQCKEEFRQFMRQLVFGDMNSSGSRPLPEILRRSY